MKRFLFLLLILNCLTSIFTVLVSEQGCSISLSDLQEPEPLFFDSFHEGNYALKQPIDGVLKFKSKSVFYTSCYRKLNPDYRKIRCLDGALYVVGENINITSIPKCLEPYKVTVQKKLEKCFSVRHVKTQPGMLLSVGFFVPTPHGRAFLEVYELCYNFETHSPSYASYYINGHSVGQGMRKKFQNSPVQKGISMTSVDYDRVLNIEEILKRLRSILGIAHTEFFEKNYGKYIGSAQLAVGSDFPMSSWRSTTNLFENSFLQWQRIQINYIEELEKACQMIASEVEHMVHVYAVAEDVLKLSGVKGMTKITLKEGDLMNVPKFFHKILATSKKIYHFVVSNCPYNYNNCETYECPNGEDTDTCNEYIEDYDTFSNADKKILKCCKYSKVDETYQPDEEPNSREDSIDEYDEDLAAKLISKGELTLARRYFNGDVEEKKKMIKTVYNYGVNENMNRTELIENLEKFIKAFKLQNEKAAGYFVLLEELKKDNQMTNPIVIEIAYHLKNNPNVSGRNFREFLNYETDKNSIVDEAVNDLAKKVQNRQYEELREVSRTYAGAFEKIVNKLVRKAYDGNPANFEAVFNLRMSLAWKSQQNDLVSTLKEELLKGRQTNEKLAMIEKLDELNEENISSESISE